jgi:hypothetical protein
MEAVVSFFVAFFYICWKNHKKRREADYVFESREGDSYSRKKA